MADHEELVAEMAALEQMGTQERQKLAKKRRLQQLKKWTQREKEWIAKEKQLNKRLASIINEENNGLNLKQYTTYNSNQRTKKRLVNSNNHNNNNNIDNFESEHANNNNNTRSVQFNSITTTTATTTTTTNTGQQLVNNNNNNDHLAIDATTNYANRLNHKTLAPNGRVHFDHGVMLLEAAARNDFDEVKRLLALGVSPDSVNHDGLTALHQCCIDASEPMMRLLLEFGANVDARDTEQWTPLHAACTCGHLNLVRILVDYEANLLAVNGDGNMPFDICDDEETLNFIESQMVKRGITQEMIDITRASGEMQMLADLERQLANGCDLDEPDEHGVTQLHIAAANNYLSVVKFMLKHGANVDACDNDHWRPLHGVACWGNESHIKIVELLVEAGASIDARTLSDETVFDLCDNVDLLERLNQLKDELENRQAASDSSRLRRTQSRTNSRVHSVRRTSVRDKNQISRREAREEAMLRVESETSLPPNGGGGPSPGEPQTNGGGGEAAAGHKETDLDLVDGPQVTTATASVEGGDTNGISAQQQQQQQIIISNGSQPDIELNGRGDAARQARDADKPGGHSLPLASGEQAADKTPTSQRDDLANGKPLSLTILSVGQGNSSAPHNHHQQSVSMNSLPPAPAHANGATTTRLESISCDLNDKRSVSNTSSTCSSSASAGTTTVQVQFSHQAANYTLAHLKKHRSDLRMRTSTIGGNTTTTSNSASVVSAAAAAADTTGKAAPDPSEMTTRQHPTTTGVVVQLQSPPAGTGPAGGSLSTATQLAGGGLDGRPRPESPGLTFRKFHGEPSEAIGPKGGRRGCCAIM